MRVTTYALGITASVVATIAGFGGCGGTVAVGGNSTTTGTGGHGGHGGHGTTVTVGSSSSTTTSSSGTGGAPTSSSSGVVGTGGGPVACDAACSHLQACTGFTCMQVGLNCNNAGTQFECVANCVAGTPCNQFGFTTLQACQGKCSDGGVPEGGITDGAVADANPGIACGACIVQSCQGQAFACGTNATCQGWLACIAGCEQGDGGAGCYQTCDTMSASAQSLFDPVYTCACQKCSTSCGPVLDPCAHGTDGGP